MVDSKTPVPLQLIIELPIEGKVAHGVAVAAHGAVIGPCPMGYPGIVEGAVAAFKLKPNGVLLVEAAIPR